MNGWASAGKKLGRPSGAPRHEAQLTGGPACQWVLTRETVRALWAVGLDGGSTDEGRRQRRIGRQRARTLEARWGSIGDIPWLQQGRRGGQTNWKTMARRGAVAAELGVP